jgi:hypothetical protein
LTDSHKCLGDIGPEVDKSATNEAMHAFKTRRRTEEWTQDGAAHGSADHDAHGSAEVRSLYCPKYSEVYREQGVPYREFLFVKRTVNGLAGSMSNLERKMDRLVKSLESFERSNANASSNQSSGPPPPAPFPNFPEQRTGIPKRREADELFVKVI